MEHQLQKLSSCSLLQFLLSSQRQYVVCVARMHPLHRTGGCLGWVCDQPASILSSLNIKSSLFSNGFFLFGRTLEELIGCCIGWRCQVGTARKMVLAGKVHRYCKVPAALQMLQHDSGPAWYFSYFSQVDCFKAISKLNEWIVDITQT